MFSECRAPSALAGELVAPRSHSLRESALPNEIRCIASIGRQRLCRIRRVRVPEREVRVALTDVSAHYYDIGNTLCTSTLRPHREVNASIE